MTLLPQSHPSRREESCSPTLGPSDASISQSHAQMAQDVRPFLPPGCRWLTQEGVKLANEHQTAAGGYADIYEVFHGGHKAILKSYRCYVLFDAARVVKRFYNEVHVWTLLHHKGVDVVPFLGIFSNEAHPFGIVYDRMGGLDLKQYLGGEPNVGGVKLLTEIARALSCMHKLGIVHGNLETANILVDGGGGARIAGLGNATILPHSEAWTMVEGETSADRLARGHTPEPTWGGPPSNPTDTTHPTTADDILALGVVSWEVLTGRVPFCEMTKAAASHSMLKGVRPQRPNGHRISDRMWYIIEHCWHSEPSERISIEEAVSLLETELGHA